MSEFRGVFFQKGCYKNGVTEIIQNTPHLNRFRCLFS